MTTRIGSRTIGSLVLLAFATIVTFVSGRAITLAQQPTVASLPPAWVLPPPAQVAPAQTVVVRAGKMFDPRSGTLLTNQTIVIRGDRIVDVGSSPQIPQGARVIDLSRATVLPGLIDTHLHTMDGNPLIAPGGPGIGPERPGPVGLNAAAAVSRARRAGQRAARSECRLHDGRRSDVARRLVRHGRSAQRHQQRPRARSAHAGGRPGHRQHQQGQVALSAARTAAPISNLGAQVANGP